MPCGKNDGCGIRARTVGGPGRSFRGNAVRHPSFRESVVHRRRPQLERSAFPVGCSRPPSAIPVKDLVHHVPQGVAQGQVLAPVGKPARVERTQRILQGILHIHRVRIVRHHQVGSRGKSLACREVVAYAASNFPPGQIHFVGARVVKLDELLRIIVASGVIHDFVDDDGGGRGWTVRFARRAVVGIETPRRRAIRITPLRYIGQLVAERDPALHRESVRTGQK